MRIGYAGVRMFFGLMAIACLGCNVHSDSALAQAPEKASGEKSGTPRHTNHLARESSPYLLLHAHNPVDWYPWGTEALQKARTEKKPIFLSVGYSSCYWCHVMERLVFENEKIAEYLNENFVCIKVDREERPDIDDIYMTSLLVYFQAIGSNQGGGWPLSMFLTPEGQPFAGGTYFPPEDTDDRLGFLSVAGRVSGLWKDRQKDVRQNAEIITAEVRRLMKPKLVLQPVKIERSLVEKTEQAILETHDEEFGGLDFSEQHAEGPKFPVPVKVGLLQYAGRREGNEAATAAVNHTLTRIARGGIRDHLGGGFHRYSTDRQWHVPHFEKMLYDQAQLTSVYLDAYAQSRDPLFRTAAEEICDFVLRDMTNSGGGFFSALDAETDGVEGKYYVWSAEEIDRILGEDAELFRTVYSATGEKTFEHGYVLHLEKPLSEYAAELKLSETELDARLAKLRARLLEARGQRPALLKDDKVITSWNGLMIRALAQAGAALDRPDYLTAAAKAADFLTTNLRNPEGRLLRTWRGGQAHLAAYLDDYAFLVEGLLALHEATGEQKWLTAARSLTDQQIEHYWDKTGHAFFFTAHDSEELIVRTKNANDGVLPSGNSVAVRNLLRLASLTDTPRDRELARQTLEVFAPAMVTAPTGMANMALAMGEFLDEPDFRAGHQPAGQPPLVDPFAAALAEVESAQVQQAAGKSGEQPGGEIRQVAGEADAKKDELVKARAFLNVDRLPPGARCRIVMFLDVSEGWHINTNPARPDFLVPTAFTMTTKHGTKLTDVKYPAGKQLNVKGFDEALHVYEGRVALYGVLTAPQQPRAEMEEFELKVRYQACNDQKCLAPKTIVLKGKVAFATREKPARLINEKFFPKPER